MPTTQRSTHWLRVLLLFFLLAAAWLLWSGFFKPLLLALGLFSCVITMILAKRMRYFESDVFALRFSWKLLGHWVWLSWQVLKSSLEVSRVVLDPKLPISPRVFDLKATAKHPVDHVILGNSITLTPGTLSLDVYQGVIKVHALTEAGAKDLMSGEMDRRVAALRGDE